MSLPALDPNQLGITERVDIDTLLLLYLTGFLVSSTRKETYQGDPEDIHGTVAAFKDLIGQMVIVPQYWLQDANGHTLSDRSLNPLYDTQGKP